MWSQPSIGISSVISRTLFTRGRQRHASSPPPGDDADRDQRRARELQRMQRLSEEDDGEEHAAERLRIREERRARWADLPDRRKPEQVREDERPDDRVDEPDPDERAPVVA